MINNFLDILNVNWLFSYTTNSFIISALDGPITIGHINFLEPTLILAMRSNVGTLISTPHSKFLVDN